MPSDVASTTSISAGNEIVVEIDRTQIEQRMASTRENYRLMRGELLKIV
jgi:hypothetical protein